MNKCTAIASNDVTHTISAKNVIKQTKDEINVSFIAFSCLSRHFSSSSSSSLSLSHSHSREWMPIFYVWCVAGSVMTFARDILQQYCEQIGNVWAYRRQMSRCVGPAKLFIFGLPVYCNALLCVATVAAAFFSFHVCSAKGDLSPAIRWWPKIGQFG